MWILQGRIIMIHRSVEFQRTDAKLEGEDEGEAR